MSEKNVDLSRRSFIKNAGIAGVSAGAAAVLGNLPAKKAEAALDVNYISVYESVMGDSGRMYSRAAKCPGPTGPVAFENRKISSSEIIEESTYDVVIVGAGMTGMMAALKAVDEGKSVMVLEKMSAGRGIFECYGSVNSTVLKNAGEELSAADKVELIRQFYDTADWRLRRGAVHTFVERSGEAADFMERMFGLGDGGLSSIPVTATSTMPSYESKFHVPHFMAPGSTVADVGLPGVYVVRELATVGLNKYPNLFNIKYLTPAVQLVREEGGPVTGVIAKNGKGYLKFNARKGVILASGGYDSNPEMMEAFCRSEDYAHLNWWNGHFGTTGDGHMMGMKVGAIMDSVPHAVMSFSMNITVGTSKFVKWSTNMSMFMGTAIQVNRAGKRFMDESLPLSKTSYVVNASGAQEDFGGSIWYICGSGPIDRSGGPSVDLLKARGHYHEASTLEELARLCGIDPQGLRSTVDKWNTDCSNSLDTEFGRGVTQDSTINSSTYYAVKSCTGFVLATVSGLQIDEHCRVLDTNDKPIEGLYAGGNVSGSLYAGHYPRHLTGTSVGRAMTFGFVAAEHACNR